MPELCRPSADLRDSWLESRDEWGRGVHQDGSGLHPEDDVETVAGFSAWVDRLIAEGNTSVPAAPGRVHSDYCWIVEDGVYLGAIALRHALTEFLLRVGGHVGYGIRPSARGNGLAGWALHSILPRARELGLDRLLITCADDNLASARTIEKSGGRLEDVRVTELGLTRRYWLAL
jgi:predicted acetyltransferase